MSTVRTDMETKESNADFGKLVSEALKELEFEAEIEPDVTGPRPDIVARSGDKIVVIECKIGDPSATIPSVSLPQVIDYGRAIKSKYGQKKVSTIVMTNQKVPPKLKEMFSANGVVISSVSSFDVSEIKGVIRDSLKQAGGKVDAG